ncbi:MAG: radical SAM protein [Desulfurococcaceae archaeon]
MFNGFKVILTGDESLVSTYHRTYLGFSSGLPMDVLPALLGPLLFPCESDEHGRMKTTQYGLCKIEASLLDSGFSSDEVAIIDPRKLDRAVGPGTRVVGISVLDPLGINYGTALLRVVLKLMGIETRLQSYMSWATMKLLTHPAILENRERLRIVVGGPGVWEIIATGLQRKLGIDSIVEGEGELVVPELFKRALSNESLPSYVKGPPVPVGKIPVIRTPSRGLVEVSRGCGRGCKFCNPTLLMYRVIPLEKVLQEVKVNVLGGESKITLHSEDFFRYGSSSLHPRREMVLKLTETVLKVPGVENVSVDFATASTVVTDPWLVKKVGDMLGLGESNYSIIQLGIETASPRLLQVIAPGKPKPFTPDEWPKIVEEAISILNDAGWWICATLIVGLPGESPDDVRANLKLVERLEPYNVFVFPLPFIPSGSLRKAKGVFTRDLLPTHDNLELISVAVYDAVKKIRKLSAKMVASAPSIIKQVLGGLLYFAASVGLRRLQRNVLDLSRTFLKRHAPR